MVSWCGGPNALKQLQHNTTKANREGIRMKN